MTEAAGEHVVEEGKRFSQSMLFSLMRRFYQTRGTRIWDEGILPSWITNNPHLADGCAQVIQAYLRDVAGEIDPAHPIYIVELSAGAGGFGFLVLKKLLAMKGSAALRGLDVRYVLTDFSTSTVNDWSKNPVLRPFIEAGTLELGLFDVTSDREIRLLDGRVLSRETVKNPLVVLANYAFDVWPQDLFKVEGGKLHEVLITLKHATTAEPDLSAPDVLEHLSPSHTFRTIQSGYYDDPVIDDVLDGYAGLGDTVLAMPITAFQTLRRLFGIAGRRLLLLGSDKAYTHEEQLSGLDMRAVQLHGASFSMAVNYHAVGRFFEREGGVYAAPTPRFGGLRATCALQTACFLLGGDAEAFADTLLAFRQQFEELGGPADFAPLYVHEQRDRTTVHLEHFLGLLRLSRWDPVIVFQFGRTALEEAHDAEDQLKTELRLALERAFDNFFPIGRDLPFELARFSLALKRPLDAIRYGRVSLELFGEHPVTLSNLGIAHHYAGDRAEALRCFARSIVLAPSYATPRTWRDRVEST